jgi:transcription antitermination protein NusB
MASNRHLGRIVALQTLYEYEFRSELNDQHVEYIDILRRNMTEYSSSIDDVDFVNRLVAGVLQKTAELDEKLQPLAPDWPLSTIARIDRAILRMGLYELTYSTDDVPPKVVINEAVELAKAFGSDNSGKFINGVLGTALRSLQEDADNENK